MSSKVKSSVYVDGEIWRRFKKYAAEQEREVSVLLEELMREELMIDLQAALEELAEQGEIELDFEPVKPATGLVSGLVREMRDEREIVYLDTSAIVKRYVDEPGSEFVRSLYRSAYAGGAKLASSVWNIGEMLGVLDKAYTIGRRSEEDRVAAKRRFLNELNRLTKLGTLTSYLPSGCAADNVREIRIR
ncbi:MAG: type II toxin-antitoxin system VapC family toxin [Candidatus Caldarchaeum sp.]